MKQQLDPVLSALAHDAPFDVASGGVMEGVWERVGAINARREQTMRSALFASLFAVGLGVGAATVQPPAYAQETSYQIFNEARLSPAALLNVNP